MCRHHSLGLLSSITTAKGFLSEIDFILLIFDLVVALIFDLVVDLFPILLTLPFDFFHIFFNDIFVNFILEPSRMQQF